MDTRKRRLSPGTRAVAAASLASLAMLGGCGEPSGTGWRGQVRDSAGVSITENPVQGVWSEAERWAAGTDLSIGVPTGNEAEEFGRISGLAVGSDGTIYVLDQQNHEIRAFDPAGDLSRSWGRSGRGPGELGMVTSSIMVLPGDTVVVPDGLNARINVYTSSGEVLDALPWPAGSGSPVAWAAADRLICRYFSADWDGLVALQPDGGLDSLYRFVYPSLLEAMGIEAGRVPDRIEVNPFAVQPAWAVYADGRFATATTAAKRIEIHAADGRLERVVLLAGGRKPVSAGEREAIQQLWKARQEAAGIPPQIAERIQLAVPDSFPAFATLAAGPDGTLWIQHIADVEGMDVEGLGAMTYERLGSQEWSVVDSAGRYLGDVELPVRARLLFSRAGSVFAVTEGDLGEDRVVRIALRRSE